MTQIRATYTESAPRPTSRPCEICGHSDEPTLRATKIDARLVAIERRGRNRARVAPAYARMAGVPQHANKMACDACYRQILDVLNA